ncbi:unnamed protein product [Prunus armeniaca]|uniref:Uncharacterized protein n=1 Tax=Prunus armeniaca TaxID=36596 RepID=A0A6J5TMQ2_PRUAR|nr:hypothetical protein GBA52_002673 [Prunus armeniaca]CAB4264942.1 unnamed protein product [Prunus armeniaca]CAB4295540.1 unnamed protein product [Prunus armeniaca]
MASSSPKSKHFSCSCKTTMFVVSLILLLTGSCSGARLGKTVILADPKVLLNLEHTKTLNPRTHQTGFQYRGQVFSFFPKGTPIPPSGPSKRHNSAVDSTPHN